MYTISLWSFSIYLESVAQPQKSLIINHDPIRAKMTRSIDKIIHSVLVPAGYHQRDDA